MLDVPSVGHFAYSRRYLFDALNETLIERYAETMPFINLQETMYLKGYHLFTEFEKLMFIDNVHLTVLERHISRTTFGDYQNLFQY